MRPDLLAFWFHNWLPGRASTLAPKVDHLFETLVGVSALLVLILVVLNLYFLVHYRRGSTAPRPPMKIKSSYLEAGWITGTTVIFVAFFFWGAKIYLNEERPPLHAVAINLTARQWMWDIRQPNGRREFNEVHVPVHENVRLLMTSEDVIHSFYVPAFRYKQDIVPGKQTTGWFRATKPGVYGLYCAEYCGTDHSRMLGKVIVMPRADYAAWLASGNAMEQMAARGRQLFQRFGCIGCHIQPSSIHAPPLEHVYGSLVPLSDGRKVRADDAYLRDSILRPGKDVVAGYKPVMPSFQNVISEGQLLDLIAYLKSLPAANASPVAPTDANPAPR